MNPEFIALVIVVLYVLAGLGVLFLGGRLVRRDLEHGETEDTDSRRSPSRLVEDLRPLQDVVVEFFARSEYFSRILCALARGRKPSSLITVAQEVRPEAGRSPEGNPTPSNIAWPAACIMAATGLVRFGRRGVVLTDIGREVERRIHDDSGQFPRRGTAARGSAGIHAAQKTMKQPSNDNRIRYRHPLGVTSRSKKRGYPAVHYNDRSPEVGAMSAHLRVTAYEKRRSESPRKIEGDRDASALNRARSFVDLSVEYDSQARSNFVSEAVLFAVITTVASAWPTMQTLRLFAGTL